LRIKRGKAEGKPPSAKKIARVGRDTEERLKEQKLGTYFEARGSVQEKSRSGSKERSRGTLKKEGGRVVRELEKKVAGNESERGVPHYTRAQKKGEFVKSV